MKETAIKNTERFIMEVKKTGLLYGLLDQEKGWAHCHAHDEPEAKSVYLFWSDEKMAKKALIEDWAKYKVQAITLDVFLSSWLDGMQEQKVFVGANWDEKLFGLEVEAIEMKRSLLEE